jgi:hypothetical protein
MTNSSGARVPIIVRAKLQLISFFDYKSVKTDETIVLYKSWFCSTLNKPINIMMNTYSSISSVFFWEFIWINKIKGFFKTKIYFIS